MICTSRQLDRLCSLLNQLKQNVGFFNTLLSDYEIDRNNVYKIYRGLKPITKSFITQNLEIYLNNEVLKSFSSYDKMRLELFRVDNLTGNHDKIIGSGEEHTKFFIETTTGTTGMPFPVVKNANTRMIESRYLLNKRRAISPKVNLDNGFLIIHQIDPVLQLIDWNDNEKNMEVVFQRLLEKKPKWIFSTAFLLKKFGKYVEDNGLIMELNNIDIEFIEVTSQTLCNEDKKHLEDIFSTKIINQYGCREFWNLGYECPFGHLHINQEYLIVDLIDENGEIIDSFDNEGEIIVTSLVNTSMPFVKYYLGDLACIHDIKCECGNPSPIISLAPGRLIEKITNTSAYGSVVFRKVLRRLHFHEKIEDIDKILIIQDEQYHITVYLDKLLKEKNRFESRFIEISYYIEKDLSRFSFSFVYDYIFDNQNVFKEQIFINRINV